MSLLSLFKNSLDDSPEVSEPSRFVLHTIGVVDHLLYSRSAFRIFLTYFLKGITDAVAAFVVIPLILAGAAFLVLFSGVASPGIL